MLLYTHKVMALDSMTASPGWLKVGCTYDMWVARGDKNNELTPASISNNHEAVLDNAQRCILKCKSAKLMEPSWRVCVHACTTEKETIR